MPTPTRARPRALALPLATDLRARARTAAAALLASLLLAALALPAARAADGARADAPPAAALATPDAEVPFDPEVLRGTLDNGLRYFIRRNPEPRGRAELRLVVLAGSLVEAGDQRGAAHYLEHMAFNGTARFPENDLVAFLQRAGIRFGADLNAYTSFEETVYMLPIPTADATLLPTGLDVLRDWAGGITLDEAQFEAERGVVMSEYRRRLGAGERVSRELIPLLYAGGPHPERLPIGTEASLQAMDVEALRRYYRDWYRPSLMAVVAVGDLDPAAVEAMVRARFGDLRDPPDAPPRPAPARFSARDADAVHVIADDELTSTAVQLQLPWRERPVARDHADALASLRRGLVAQMLNQRLAEALEANPEAALQLRAGDGASARGQQSLGLMAGANAGGAEAATRVLLDELERVRRDGVRPDELEAAIQRSLAGLRARAEGSATRTSSARVQELVSHVTDEARVPPDAWFVEALAGPLAATTPADMAPLVAEVLGPPNGPLLLAAWGPPTADGAPPADAEALRALLAGRAARTLDASVAEAVDGPLLPAPAPGERLGPTEVLGEGHLRVRYANGVSVELRRTDFRDDEIQLAGIRPGGVYTLPEAQRGAAGDLLALFEETGWGAWSASALRRRLAGENAQAQLGLREHHDQLAGASTRASLETMLQLLHLKMTAPRGDARLLAARQAQIRALLPQYVTTPEYRVSEAWRLRDTGEQPGQARPDDPALLDATVEDMRAIHRARFANARGFELILIGDLDPEATLPLVDRWLGGLPAEAAPPPAPRGDERLEYPVAPGTFTTRAGREAKAEWRLAMHAPAEASPDALLRLMALHESLRIVLTEALREEMGSTYSPSASRWLDPTGTPRQFIRIDLELAPDQVDAARARVERELARLAAEGPSADVLDRVVAGWLAQLPMSLRTNGYWRGRFVNTRVQPALESDPDTLEPRARALTPEALVPLARALFVDGVRLEQVVLPEDDAASDAARSE